MGTPAVLRMRLTVDVKYVTNGEKAKVLEKILLGAVERLVDNGELSGYSGAEVVCWDSKVEKVKK